MRRGHQRPSQLSKPAIAFQSPQTLQSTTKDQLRFIWQRYQLAKQPRHSMAQELYGSKSKILVLLSMHLETQLGLSFVRFFPPLCPSFNPGETNINSQKPIPPKSPPPSHRATTSSELNNSQSTTLTQPDSPNSTSAVHRSPLPMVELGNQLLLFRFRDSLLVRSRDIR